ncbi:hypothetical protein LINGRAHAP2_LOCUS23185 [Linum grandiflorum]
MGFGKPMTSVGSLISPWKGILSLGSDRRGGRTT